MLEQLTEMNEGSLEFVELVIDEGVVLSPCLDNALWTRYRVVIVQHFPKLLLIQK